MPHFTVTSAAMVTDVWDTWQSFEADEDYRKCLKPLCHEAICLYTFIFIVSIWKLSTRGIAFIFGLSGLSEGISVMKGKMERYCKSSESSWRVLGFLNGVWFVLVRK